MLNILKASLNITRAAQEFRHHKEVPESTWSPSWRSPSAWNSPGTCSGRILCSGRSPWTWFISTNDQAECRLRLKRLGFNFRTKVWYKCSLIRTMAGRQWWPPPTHVAWFLRLRLNWLILDLIVGSSFGNYLFNQKLHAAFLTAAQ